MTNRIIVFIFLVLISCRSNKDNSQLSQNDMRMFDHFNKQNLDTISAVQFLEGLAGIKENVIYSEGLFRSNFVTKSDLLLLVSYLDDKRSCPSVIDSKFYGSFSGKQSTIGFEAYRLLNGYFLSEYPVGHRSQTKLKYSKKEVKEKVRVELSRLESEL